jgi:DNA-binding CsgD family transcriptional regulator
MKGGCDERTTLDKNVLNKLDNLLSHTSQSLALAFQSFRGESQLGETYMSDPIRSAFLKGMFVSKAGGNHHFNGSTVALSVREAEIFHQIGHGKKLSEIARELALSLKTVQAYCGRIKEKRGFANLRELQFAAVRQAT